MKSRLVPPANGAHRDSRKPPGRTKRFEDEAENDVIAQDLAASSPSQTLFNNVLARDGKAIVRLHLCETRTLIYS